MSAPPIAITMWTPRSSAITVMPASDVRPDSGAPARMKTPPSQITINSPAKFITCRPGRITGLPLILPASLPKAINEPEKVTAPIRTPR